MGCAASSQTSGAVNSSSSTYPHSQNQHHFSDAEELEYLRHLMSTSPEEDSRMYLIRRILAIKQLFPSNLAIKHFDLDYFLALPEGKQKEFLWIINSGIKAPDSMVGCYAMHSNDYEYFSPFFSKVIAEYHKVDVNARHKSDWNLPAGGKLDLAALGLPPLSMRVRVGRNLVDFPLPGSMSKDERVRLEKKMCEAFSVLTANPAFGGRYYSLTPGHPDQISATEYEQLVHEHVMFKDMSQDGFMVEAGIARDWPYGRGCWVSADRQCIVWVGEEDHLRIMAMKKGTVLNEVFERLRFILDTIEAIPGLHFATVDGRGFVTSCPANLGTGMRASVHLQLPHLTKDGTDTKLKALARPMHLSVRGLGGEHTPIGRDGTVDISPSTRYCITEGQILQALFDGVQALLELERAAAKL